MNEHLEYSNHEDSKKQFPLSENQKGLWVLQTITPNMSAYNIPICFQYTREINSDILQLAFLCTLQKYPILTSIFLQKNKKL
ncbi:condensation domain-containing protein [Candidatus Profftella armatura]